MSLLLLLLTVKKQYFQFSRCVLILQDGRTLHTYVCIPRCTHKHMHTHTHTQRLPLFTVWRNSCMKCGIRNHAVHPPPFLQRNGLHQLQACTGPRWAEVTSSTDSAEVQKTYGSGKFLTCVPGDLLFKYRAVFYALLQCSMFLTVTALSKPVVSRGPDDVNESFV